MVIHLNGPQAADPTLLDRRSDVGSSRHRAGNIPAVNLLWSSTPQVASNLSHPRTTTTQFESPDVEAPDRNDLENNPETPKLVKAGLYSAASENKQIHSLHQQDTPPFPIQPEHKIRLYLLVKTESGHLKTTSSSIRRSLAATYLSTVAVIGVCGCDGSEQTANTKRAKPAVVHGVDQDGDRPLPVGAVGRFIGHQAAVGSVSFSPDGKSLASAGFDGTVRLWNLADAKQILVLQDSTPNGRSVAFSPDGRHIAATCGKHQTDVVVWDTGTGKARYRFPVADMETSASVAFSRDGKRMATGAFAYRGLYSIHVDYRNPSRNFGTIEVWDHDEFKEHPYARNRPDFRRKDFHLRGALSNYRKSVGSVAFSPDGTTLATGGGNENYKDSSICLWKVPEGKLIRKFGATNWKVEQIAYSPDGQLLVSVVHQAIHLWNPKDGSLIGKLTEHKATLTAVVFSPDAKYLASASTDGTVPIWDMTSKTLVTTLSGHKSGALCVAFSPKGRLLATGGEDTTILLWDVAAILSNPQPAKPSAESAGKQAQQKEATPEKQAAKAKAVMEAEIRKAAGKPTGQLTKADFEKVTKFFLQNKQIADLTPLAKLTQLRTLQFYYNQVTDLKPLAELKELEQLWIWGNKIADLTPLAELTKLTVLEISGNQITDLKPLAGLTGLTRLNLSVNQVADLTPLARLTGLTKLEVSGNQITDLKPLAGMTELTRLELTHNQITDLKPLAGLAGLEWLDLTNNQITNLKPLAGLTELKWLRLGTNQITDLKPLAGLTQLRTLELDRNPGVTKAGILSLQKAVPKCTITHDAKFSEKLSAKESGEVIEAAIGKAAGKPTGVLTKADLVKVTSLDIPSKNITDLKPIAGLTGLTRLDLNNNDITDLKPLARLTKLKELDLTNNQITDLRPLAALTELKRVRLYRNPITDLSPLATLTKLEGLQLDNNQITDLKSLAGLTGLENLSLDNNQITDLTPLAGLTKLSTLELSGNRINDLKPLARLRKLYWMLELSNNQITDLEPLAKLTRLWRLKLSGNQITNLKPLAAMTGLGSLELSANQITNLKPLAELTKLGRLYLNDNQITDLKPLAGLTKLRTLELDHNPNLTKAKILRLQKALPKCKITHDATK